MEVLRAKEQELLQVKRQVEALRIAAPLLSLEEDAGAISRPAVLAKNTEKVG